MAYRQALQRRAQEETGGTPTIAMFGNAPLPFSLPCTDQTAESIQRWLKNRATPGAVVVVRHARWHLYEYHLDEIARINSSGRRVQLAAHGTFGFDGDALSAPKHSLTLLEPTPAVLSAAARGCTWQHGRPAFKRPLTEREAELVRMAIPPTAANGSPGNS